MRQQMSLDLLGIDLFAAAIDQILDSSFDDQIARSIHPHQVASAIKSVTGERLAIALLGAIIPSNRIRSTAPQLADLTRCDLISARIHDPDFVARRHRPSLRR